MVLRLKSWESRSLPGLPRTIGLDVERNRKTPAAARATGVLLCLAEAWCEFRNASSPTPRTGVAPAGEAGRSWGDIQVTSLVSLRALSSGDMDMLIRWFSAPHVARWWDVQPEAVRRQKYEARLRPTTPVDVFIIEAQGAPIGMLQAVYGAETGSEGDCGLDILIGDEAALGKGFASATIAYFVEHRELHRHRIVRFIADPAAENVASTRTFERAGFAPTNLPEGMRWIRSAGEPR